MSGYRTCTPCFIGEHRLCNGEAHIYHVGSYAPEVVACACPTCASVREVLEL